jgi:gamma-glutamyltranspeptidase/glutathione hydrolase
MRRAVVALIFIVGLLTGVASAAVAPHGPPTSTGTGGAAATVETLATQAAIDTLKQGGNAVDAAVAAAGVLGVTEPLFCGIGGGGFMVIRTAKGKVVTIDGRETGPKAMTPTYFIDPATGQPLAFNDARWSGLSVGVPGTPATWDEALKKYGTMKLKQVLQPGIDIAQNGFVIDQSFYDFVQADVPWFDDIPATAAIYLDPDGTPHDVGTVQRNPDLAKTYRLLAQRGAKAFYHGKLAKAIVSAADNPVVAPTADHTWRHGVLTAHDLSKYRAIQRDPTHVTYRAYDVYSMGPPSSGGSTVGEALNILEGYNLASMTREQAFHYYLEASRYAFADRNQYLGDPDYVDVPLSGLLSKDYAATRRALITPTAANPPVVQPGNPYPFVTATKKGHGHGKGHGKGHFHASVTSTQPGTTTHVVTSDKWGNVVSYTFTIESAGGAGIVVPGYGFLLNNELTDFNFTPGTANSPDSGKRPRSSMAPTIVTKDDKPFLAVGSPGGSTIIGTVLQILFDRIDEGMTLPNAIADPRADQRNGATSSAEPAFISSPLATQLQARGHAFSNAGEIGAATGLEFLPAGHVLAAAEPVRRGTGSALVENP